MPIWSREKLFSSRNRYLHHEFIAVVKWQRFCVPSGYVVVHCIECCAVVEETNLGLGYVNLETICEVRLSSFLMITVNRKLCPAE